MHHGEHGVGRRERKDKEEREREKRLHSPFALHPPIQWAIYGDVTAEEGDIKHPSHLTLRQSEGHVVRLDDLGLRVEG